MTKVISGEFDYLFDFYIEEPRFISVSGTATIRYEAECYSKDEGWSVESINIADLMVEEAFNDEGNEAKIDPSEIIRIADFLNDKESGVLVERALEDAMERDFWG